MNLGEAKKKTLMLLDEYSSGGEITIDEDIMLKMNQFFDLGQKDMAMYQPIIKKTEVQLQEWVNLPTDFRSQFRNWIGGRQVSTFPVVGGKMYCPNQTGNMIVEYYAYPTTITDETPDTYEFEVKEDAANCLPFYVAAQQLITDLVVDYQALWNMYLTHKASVDTSLPSGGSFGGVRQTLFR